MLFGALGMYSVAGGIFDATVKKQLATIALSSATGLLIAKIEQKLIYRSIIFFYVIFLFLLLFTTLFGHKAMGAQRWINFGILNIQPAEFIKILIILALSQYFHVMSSGLVMFPLVWIVPFIIVLFPVSLIVKQPNLGTATIIILNVAAILYLAGTRTMYFIVSGILFLAAMPVFWLNLHPYQKKRVIVFLHPESDPLGSGYNILQSIISIGSGGTYGKGFVNGSQNQLKFLPENHTDFIFALIAEEGGFITCLVVFIVYLALLSILLIFSLRCTSQFGRLFIAGYAVLLFLHVFINIAMISGILPVVGVPLPFLSYGGSNIMAMTVGAALSANFFHNRTSSQL